MQQLWQGGCAAWLINCAGLANVYTQGMKPTLKGVCMMVCLTLCHACCLVSCPAVPRCAPLCKCIPRLNMPCAVLHCGHAA
jgi:hypothetical protein